MRVRFEISKAGERLHHGIYDVDDSANFGAACAQAWTSVREQAMAEAASIGELMDRMNDSVIDKLNGAEIRLTRA